MHIFDELPTLSLEKDKRTATPLRHKGVAVL